MEIQSKERDTTMKENITALLELHDRAAKISEALYRTTDLFSDAEPLKWSLRESGVKILNIISSVGRNPSHEELRDLRRIESLINSLFSKIDLAASGTFIARANFDVLKREYRTLSEYVLTSEFLTVSLPGPVHYAGLLQTDITDKRTSGMQRTNTEKVEITFPQEIAKPLQKSPEFIPHRTENVSMSERQEMLLKLLRENGSGGVGDLTRLLGASISEKTVQRDLNMMVQSGLIRKEGEKRWRRYYSLL